MNELHLINRSYNDKLSNRNQHIAYLEDSLRTFQDKNLRLVTIHIENERKLREEETRLNSIIDSFTTQLWQEGDGKVPLESRIVVPFQGIRPASAASSALGPLCGVVGRSGEHRDELDTGMYANETLNTRKNGAHRNDTKPMSTRGGMDPNTNTNDANMYIGGKNNEYVPKRFTSKRGRLIKSATLRPTVEKGGNGISSNSGLSGISGSNTGLSDGIDLATVIAQINNLDALAKSWTKCRDMPTME